MAQSTHARSWILKRIKAENKLYFENRRFASMFTSDKFKRRFLNYYRIKFLILFQCMMPLSIFFFEEGTVQHSLKKFFPMVPFVFVVLETFHTFDLCLDYIQHFHIRNSENENLLLPMHAASFVYYDFLSAFSALRFISSIFLFDFCFFLGCIYRYAILPSYCDTLLLEVL